MPSRTTAVRAVAGLRHDLRVLLSQHPAYVELRRFMIERLDWRGGHPLADDSELLIEGFPRSANSFAMFAFHLAQRRTTKIADHLHSAGHVLLAVRRKIPTLVLVRAPEDAVLSAVISSPSRTLRGTLREYAWFYERILPNAQDLLVADFDTVTRDFGGVIRQINRRFGTAFDEFQHTEENVRKCFDAIAARHTEVRPKASAVQARAVPSKERKLIKERLVGEFRSPLLRQPRERAEQIYRTFLALARETFPPVPQPRLAAEA